jgi:transcriptional regulator with XRE-family HTH domain
MLNVHVNNFISEQVSLPASFSRRGIPCKNRGLAWLPMTHDPETPREKQEHKKNILAEQKAMLQHVPAWLRFRGMNQRQLAERLGVKEASLSKWLAGTDNMRVGLLRQIARIVKAEDGDLMEPPPGKGLTSAVSDLMDAADGLDAEQLAHLAAMARLLKRKPD